MRINLYSQELNLDPAQVKIVAQQADNGITYHGIRLFVHSSNRLHDTPEDDDRSAITFWLPKSGANREALHDVFDEMASLVLMAPSESGLD